MNTQAMAQAKGLSGEDWARADFYALLGNLFHAAPTADLLRSLASSSVMTGNPDTDLSVAWSALIEAAKQTDAAQVCDEYEGLFVGVGKPELLMFGSYYQAGFLNEKPLVRLRDDLAALGLERQRQTTETEDHLAFLCEVMRFLIVDANPPKPFSDQKAFFSEHVASWVFRFLDDLQAHPKARFYGATGQLARAFFDVERQSFDFEV
jgi:TorA maturation chaperone TorD